MNNDIKNIFTKKTIYQQLFFEQTIKKGETNIYKMIFFFMVHFYAIILNLFLLMPSYTDLTSIISISYIIITSIIFIYYYILFNSNPGYLDNSNSHYSNLLEVLEDKKDVTKYCPITFILIEGNSKFCLICQKYIKGFNHHCYWVGNCIGEQNFQKFMFFLVLCIINIGYNLLLIIIYFLSGFLHLKKDNITDNRGFLLKLMNVIRGCLGLLGMYICIVFLIQLIELFKYHYKALKEKNKNKQKNI